MLVRQFALSRPSFARAFHVASIVRAEELEQPPRPAPVPEGPPRPKNNQFPVKLSTKKDSPPKTTRNPNTLPPLALGIHCQSTRNNTAVTVTSSKNVVAWFSAGRCGFKGSNRASYEAGYQCAKQSFASVTSLLQKHPGSTIDLYFKGFGQGREAMRTALLAVEGAPLRDSIRSVTDRTPIKIGGPRSKKARRL